MNRDILSKKPSDPVKHYTWHPTDGLIVTAWLTWTAATYLGPRTNPPLHLVQRSCSIDSER